VVLQQPRPADDAPPPRYRPATPNGGSPVEVVRYLRQLSELLVKVSDVRRGWIHELQPIIEEAYHRDPTAVARQAAQLGRAQLGPFRDARLALGRMRPPGDCLACHAAAASWLDHHVTACERLIRLGDIRDVKRLATAREPLDEARAAAQRINTEYARLVANLRRCIPRHAPQHRGLGLFGGGRRTRPARRRRS